MHLLDEARIESLVTFENKGIFDAIDNRYNFGVVTFENQGQTDDLHAIFKQRDLDILQSLDKDGLDISRRVLAEYSSEARIFPYLTSQEEADVLDTILQQPTVSEEIGDSWFVNPYAELHRGSDTDRFVESEEDGDYPVYGGSNIFQFAHDPIYIENLERIKFWSVDESRSKENSAKWRVREKNLPKLKRAIYDEFDGTGSQVGFVNDLLEDTRGQDLSEEDVLLDCTTYRIAYRDIARSSDERTMITTVLPPGVVAHDKAPTFRPYKINPSQEDLEESPLHGVYEKVFEPEELFVATGLLNSIPFDFIMRTKVDSTVVFYKLKESQAPRLTKGDEWFDYIWTRAAKLNCYGDDFEDMREQLGQIEPATTEEERRRLQAELDAAAFHAYGLNREQTKFVLDDFHQVQNPRLMDDDYFDTVLEKYDSLA